MKWIIDTDPGIDDAAAIITAIRSGLDVIAITTVHGNTPLKFTTRNALLLTELLDVSTPVYAGTERPLLQRPLDAAQVHGSDGFGDANLPAPRRQPEPVHAVDRIIEAAHQHSGQLSILAIGPLTNVALAIAKDRSITAKVSRLVIMGGTSHAQGNTSIVGEFNVLADPEAAAIVFESGIPITLVPWETTTKAVIPAAAFAAIRSSSSRLAQTFLTISEPLCETTRRFLGMEGIVLCDLVAAGVAIDPAMVTEQVHTYVGVETAGTLARGLTAVDYARHSGRQPNATVCLDVDRDKLTALFVQAVSA
ncbi:MAG: hypothetical protein BAA04_12470 [Firmicutes bacterium ZCTH02-B6]|nr:MAG: hypothetical protein BAA04_12470 [Firmicutes bacterium ZCTH02-B6]